jgi:hypothetical protein
MTEAQSTFTVQVPATRASKIVPGRLSIGSADLQVGTDGTAEEAFLGQKAQRFAASWSKRTAGGRAYVEIRPTSKLTSEIVVSLEAPRGILWRLIGTGQGLRALADLFGRALRYEIETRGGAEDADGYDVRRTTPDLVKARSA